MKLLLENWREYLLKEDDASLQVLDPTGADSRVRKQMSTSTQRTAEEVAKETAWLAVQMVDITGISGYGDAGRAHDEWKKNPSAANSGWYILAALGALPIIGKLTAPLKAAKAAKKIKQMATTIEAAETTVKALKTTKNADNLVVAGKLERALPSARKEYRELIHYVYEGAWHGKATWFVNKAGKLVQSRGLQTITPSTARSLKKMVQTGKAARYAGSAYRGVHFQQFSQLLRWLTPNTARLRKSLRKQMKNLSEATDGGQWTKMDLPRGTAVRPHTDTGFTSWSKSLQQAEDFSADFGGYEMIFVTKGGELVDVHKTLHNANIIPAVDAKWIRAEQEVIGLGDTRIEEVYIRLRKAESRT